MYLPKVQRDIFFATGATSAAKQIHQKTRILHLRPNNFITNFYDGSETKRNLPAVLLFPPSSLLTTPGKFEAKKSSQT